MINIFNEEKYALDILKHGFISNKKGLDLFILAKYYRFKCNYNKQECKNLLQQFCDKYVNNSIYTDIYRTINTVINKVYNKKTKYLNIEHIEFDIHELNYINSLSISSTGKQILFCLWCCNKLNIKAGQSDKWVKIAYSELKTFCNLKSGNITTLLNELYEKDLIFVSDSCAICLKFLDEYNNYLNDIINQNKSSDCMPSVLYYISDFNTCGLWWRKYNGDKKIINCAECNTLTIRNSNRQKYCKECSSLKTLEKYEKYNHKR